MSKEYSIRILNALPMGAISFIGNEKGLQKRVNEIAQVFGAITNDNGSRSYPHVSVRGYDNLENLICGISLGIDKKLPFLQEKYRLFTVDLPRTLSEENREDVCSALKRMLSILKER